MMANPERMKIVFHFLGKDKLGEIWTTAVTVSISQANSLTWLAAASSGPRLRLFTTILKTLPNICRTW
jgi:hypothetical protein